MTYFFRRKSIFLWSFCGRRGFDGDRGRVLLTPQTHCVALPQCHRLSTNQRSPFIEATPTPPVWSRDRSATACL